LKTGGSKIRPEKTKHMKKKSYLSGVFILIFFAGILASCSKPEPVNFAGYRNVRFSNKGFSIGIIQLDVAFYNPNPFPMKIKEANMKVSIDKQPFGEITQDSARLMPAKDTFLMPVSLKVNMVDLLQKVLATSGHDSITLEATGNCKVGRKGIFMNLPLHYRSREILKMF
jgi:LEA14-like dessication related protein